MCSGLYMNWPLDKKTVSSITVKTYQMLHIFYCICFCIHIRFRKFFTELKALAKAQSFFKISSAFQHYSKVIYPKYSKHCATRKFSKSQNLRFVIEIGFKSRAGYYGACTVNKLYLCTRIYIKNTCKYSLPVR